MICIETRHAKAALNAMLNKTDPNEAKGIAQMMRTGWFRAVHVKWKCAQNAARLLVGRKALLGKVLDMEALFGLLRPFGLKGGNVANVAKQVPERAAVHSKVSPLQVCHPANSPSTPFES